LRSCPVGLAKIQQLHDIVYGIIERTKSEIVTIYNINESAKTSAQPDELYSGFPIKIEVMSPQGKADVIPSTQTVSFADALKKKVSTLKRKPLIKTGVAAAAAVLIVTALLLFLNMPTAKAVTIDQIYRAIEKAKNVYISKSSPVDPEPVEEKFISRPLNIYMAKTGKELVLWDIKNKLRKTKQLGTGLIEITPLSDDLIADVEKRITGSLGLMPFYDISEIPNTAKWSHVTDNGLQEKVQGVEIYDLIWVDQMYDGSIVFRKWRVYANVDTNLPQKAEWYKKVTANEEFSLTMIIMIEYLSDNEMQAVIKNASF
jgi:hypothetical protein